MAYGTISSTYLEYFEGVIQKLDPNEHYVLWKSGDYEYTLAHGEELQLDGSTFSGDCSTVKIYRSDSSSYSSDWYVDYGADVVSFSADQLFCYSDLGDYSTLQRGDNNVQSWALLFAIGFFVVFIVCRDIFNYVLHLRDRK